MAMRHEHARERERERAEGRVGKFGGVAVKADLMKFTHIPKIQEKA